LKKPKSLPKGLFLRGRSYYTRFFRGGSDRWISLGPDLKAAAERLSEMRGSGSVKPRLTVSQVCERWLAVYVPIHRAAKNAAMSATRVRKYLLRFMGHAMVADVRPDDLRAYRQWLERKKIKQLTVTHLLSDARCFFNWCADSSYIAKSPVPRRLMPRLQERPPDRLTDEEVGSVLGIKEPHAFVIRLALGTGMRWGELCRAQASHVENGMLTVSQTKSGKMRRIPLPTDLLREIRSRVGRLVPFAEGSPGSFARGVRHASGVQRFHVHQLRHTFACRWIERGGNLAALQQILGHASVVTTQRYASLTDEAVQREAARIATSQ
jgi:integrase